MPLDIYLLGLQQQINNTIVTIKRLLVCLTYLGFLLIITFIFSLLKVTAVSVLSLKAKVNVVNAFNTHLFKYYC